MLMEIMYLGLFYQCQNLGVQNQTPRTSGSAGIHVGAVLKF